MATTKKPMNDIRNDNITLVRAAKPVVKKDLAPRKDVKGGKKIT